MTTLTLAADATAPRSDPVPTARARLEVIDAQRGFAILGIFLINIPLMGPMGGAGETPMNPAWFDTIAQTFTDLFFEGTQRGMLQMLFGAGMIILTSKAMSPDGPVGTADNYLRRNMWLVLFGLLHIFVVRWGYDILHIYGLAALFLFTFRKLPPAAALALGLIIAGLLQYAALGGDMSAASELADKEKTAVEAKNAVQAWYGSVKGLGLWMTIAEAFGTMLIGVALFKWGIIQGQKSQRFYLAMTILGYGIGLFLRYTALQDLSATAKGPNPSEFGRIIMTLGHIGTINLLWQCRFGAWLLSPFRAAGRTAFSLYVMQSVIGIWVLWAPWGPLTQLDPGAAGVLATALLVLACQVVLAHLWLRWFDSGPLEMLWRRLVKLTS